jgi:hypothetical protein
MTFRTGCLFVVLAVLLWAAVDFVREASGTNPPPESSDAGAPEWN